MRFGLRKWGVLCCVLSLCLLIFAGCGKTETTQTNPVKTTAAEAQQKVTANAAPAATQENKQTESKQTASNAKPQTTAVKPTKKTAAKTTTKTTKKTTTKQTPVQTKGKLAVTGSGVKKTMYFSVTELKKMSGGIVADKYFALNNWGTKAYFNFKGVSIWYLLNQKVGLHKSAKKVTVTADDGYTMTFTIAEVKRNDYIDEQNPAKKYKMIIAWEENGKAYDPAQGRPFRLVVGQKAAGDINKEKWVQNVKTIKVS